MCKKQIEFQKGGYMFGVGYVRALSFLESKIKPSYPYSLDSELMSIPDGGLKFWIALYTHTPGWVPEGPACYKLKMMPAGL